MKLRIACISVGLALSAASCADPASEAVTSEPEVVRPVHVQKVELAVRKRSLVVPGIVAADARTKLAFRVDGFLARFAVDEGDRVAAGELIAELDTDDLERAQRSAKARLDRLEAQATEAGRELERQRKLLDSKTVSRRSYDTAESRFRADRAARNEAAIAVEIAEDRLVKARLSAPHDGYIEARHVEEHEATQAGVPVVTLTDLDRLLVRAAVPDRHLDLLEIGRSVVVRSSALADAELTGTISKIAVAADVESRLLPFEIGIDNEGLRFRPEMVVEVELRRSDAAPSAALPIDAVIRGADLEPFCFVVLEGRVERRLVRLGGFRGDRVLVEEGLAAGELVVTRGQYFLREGDPVRIAGPRADG